MVKDHFQGWAVECADCRWQDPHTSLLSLCTFEACYSTCGNCGSSKLRMSPVFKEKENAR